MANKIYLVAGTGGIGKSLFTMALLDYLRLYSQNEKIILIETDNRICDVSKSYQNEIQTKIIDLACSDGWLELVDLCEYHPEHTIIINTSRLSEKTIQQDIFVLPASLQALNRELISFWLLGRKIDDFELLSDFKHFLIGSTVHVVNNAFFCEESLLIRYKNSIILKDGEKKLSFPKLNPQICDDFFNNRTTVAFAEKNLAIQLREELADWRGEAKKMFDFALLGSEIMQTTPH